MSDQDLTLEQRTLIGKAEKLLRLAGNNPNEAEASAATAKAMGMLAQANVDMATLERESGGGGRRADENMRGGFYQFERDLWSAVADLNFCMYWTQSALVPREKRDAKSENYRSHQARNYIRQNQHRLVGRVHNIQATRVMAQYLQGAIERLTREFLAGYEESNMRSRRAVSFREGVAERVVEKIYDRRREALNAERRAAREAAARAAEAGMADASTSTAVTLSSLKKTEEDANRDFLYGEGYSARQAAVQARWAEEQRRAEQEHIAWAAANPEEAARQAEVERKKARRSSWNAGMGSGGEKERDWGAYRAGHARGDGLGIDPQADGGRSAGALGRVAGRLAHG